MSPLPAEFDMVLDSINLLPLDTEANFVAAAYNLMSMVPEDINALIDWEQCGPSNNSGVNDDSTVRVSEDNVPSPTTIAIAVVDNNAIPTHASECEKQQYPSDISVSTSYPTVDIAEARMIPQNTQQSVGASAPLFYEATEETETFGYGSIPSAHSVPRGPEPIGGAGSSGGAGILACQTMGRDVLSFSSLTVLSSEWSPVADGDTVFKPDGSPVPQRASVSPRSWPHADAEVTTALEPHSSVLSLFLPQTVPGTATGNLNSLTQNTRKRARSEREEDGPMKRRKSGATEAAETTTRAMKGKTKAASAHPAAKSKSSIAQNHADNANEDIDKSPMSCRMSECSFVSDPLSLWDHFKRTHQPSLLGRQIPINTEDMRVRCIFCDEEDSARKVLHHIQAIHLADKKDGEKVACSGCEEKKMVDKSNFKRHLMDVHWKIEGYVFTCQICGDKVRKDAWKNRQHFRKCLSSRMHESAKKKKGR
ncbi:uncharacterized protein FIBRA_00393 [Fibroporia radiculosa]|uniref:C2H2-type domain-containing protein n=1 Tax=Fibroporia radiculosa TaxID=599839 RepID=J4G061_9APHY|nr:uncharacterized protein FIBRA_00393 [Fibroporia radiculosa]CCL98398.1 predicted protein [Fibroporia radiculosa]